MTGSWLDRGRPSPTPAAPKAGPKQALTDALDALVADGTLTRAQADKVLAKLQTTLGDFKGRGPAGPGGRGPVVLDGMRVLRLCSVFEPAAIPSSCR